MPEKTVATTVGAREESRRLDAHVTAVLEDVTRAEVQRWIRAGRVLVNADPITKPSTTVFPGDRVEINPPPSESPTPLPRPVEFGVAHVDDHVIIVDKPAGLTVHPGAGHIDDTLVNGLLNRWPEIASVGDPRRPGIVHRLDRDTSGLLVVARSADAYGTLASMVRARRVERHYSVLAWGRVSPVEGVIDAPVGRDPRRPLRQAVESGGRLARTRFRARRFLPSTTLLEVMLETGRMHQIRVHLAAIGFPVVGDLKYGRAGFGLRRQFLHASRIAFYHPITGERIEAASPLHTDLAVALELAEAASADAD